MKKKAGPPKPSPRKPFGDKPVARYRDKAAGSFSDKPSGRSGDKPAGRFGDKPAGRFGDKPAGRFGDKPAGRFGDKPADRFGDKPAGRFGDKPAGRFGDKPAGRFGDKPAGRYGDKATQRPGESPAGDHSEKPAGPMGRKAPGRYGDKPAGRFEGKPAARFERGPGAKSLGRPFGRVKPGAPTSSDTLEYDDSAPVGRKPYAARPFSPQGERPLAKRTSHPRQRSAGAAKLELDFDDLIYGVHAIEEAMRAGEELLSLHIGIGRDRDPIVAGLVMAAERLGIPICFEKPEYYANIPYKAHQSLIAIGKPFDYVSLEEAMDIRSTGRLLVVLDHLTDPHNVGAILRTAECAGAQAVILPDRRSAGVNATVRKVAAGATSHLAVAKVGNLAQTIRTLKEHGFTVIGASLGPEAKEHTAIDMKGDVALVVGAEGEGLGRLIGRSCDVLVKIPLRGKVESLNASVAAGILLYEVVRQRQDDIS